MEMKRNVQGAIDFTVESIDENTAIGNMLIRQEILNPFGTVHAGALIWFADVIATMLVLGGSTAHEGMESFPVAVTLNAQLLSNRNSGQLVATAEWVKRGRRVSTVRTLVCDEDGRVLLDLTSTHISAR